MKRPILYPAISFCLGLAVSSYLKIPIHVLLVLAIGFVLLAVIRLRDNFRSHISLYLGIFFAGIAYMQSAGILPDNHISNFITGEPKQILVRGIIVDEPVEKAAYYGKMRTAFILKLRSFEDNHFWKKTEGLVKVNVYGQNHPQFTVGDEVVLEGLISRPHGLKNPRLFDYAKHLELNNIYAVLKVKEGCAIEMLGPPSATSLKKAAYDLRRKIRSMLDRYLDPVPAGFLKAMLIGDRSGVNEALEEDFVKTGTIHILAISGLHIVLLAGIFLFIFKFLWLPKRSGLILTTLILVFYSVVAGSNPPIIRATIMFAVIVLGRMINRETDILNSLSLAAVLILLWQPKEIFSASFQLSFVSILAIITLAPRINKILSGTLAQDKVGERPAFIGPALKKSGFYLRKSLSVSAAACLGIFPFTAYYFNIVSPIAIVANIIIIPLSSLIMGLSIAFLFAGAVAGPLAHYAAGILSVLENGIFFINRFLSKVPLAYLRTPSPAPVFFVLYYSLLSLLVIPKDAALGRVRVRKLVAIAILLLLNVIVWKEIAYSKKDLVKVTFLDVGQGDSFVIRLPGGGAILIDGGSSDDESGYDTARSVIAPYLWNEAVYRLDAVIVTHFHKDHIGGMPYILNNFDVGCVIDNGAVTGGGGGTKARDDYRMAIKNKGIRHAVVSEGDEIKFSDGVSLFVLNPPREEPLSDTNDNSIVLKLVYKEKSALFCADITESGMKRLIFYGDFLNADILKVPHHGSFGKDKEIVKDFLKKVSPGICIISTGAQRRFLGKVKDTIEVITSLGSRSYETYKDGAIEIYISAEHVKERSAGGKS